MQYTEFELGWLVGIIEGEGCLSLHRNANGDTWPALQIAMADGDVILRVAALLGLPPARVHRYSRGTGKTGPHRDQYQFTVSGKKIIPLLEAILPHLGERRAAKVRDLLSHGGYRKG